MEQYLSAVENTILNGVYKRNRTGVDTVADFSEHYTIDLQKGFPLLTTKQMSDYRWNSLIHELFWYLEGTHHIQDLREETKIWDAWADEDWNLPTAYGRFWRRFPLPSDEQQLEGEWWVNSPDLPALASEHYDNVSEKEVKETISNWVNPQENTFDQLQYVIDTLNGKNPMRSHNSRRLVVNAWNPGNASISHLPPCHFTFVLNVQNGKLNTHLTQRSADLALGVPFNIASYALLTHLIANETDFEVGKFGHTLVDTHVYTGKGKRGQWYEENLRSSELTNLIRDGDYTEAKKYILENAPEEQTETNIEEGKYGYDHVPGLLEQLSRTPLERPEIHIAEKPLDELRPTDIELKNYSSHDPLRFKVAE